MSATSPEFESPPVVETVIAARFRELPELTSARIGQFWQRYLAAELRDTQDRPPYSAPLERIGEAGATLGLQLQITEAAPSVRSWFLGGNTIVQVQSDWFACNWRKTEDEPEYVRYKQTRGQFERRFAQLGEFVAAEFRKPIVVVQAEITYVNSIPLTDEDLVAGPFGDVIRGARPCAGEYFLPAPDAAQISWSYPIVGDPRGVGRLHLQAQSSGPAIQLVLTGRGRPSGDGIEHALAFLDLAHDWVVRGFKDVTTKRMWDRWGLKGEH